MRLTLQRVFHLPHFHCITGYCCRGNSPWTVDTGSFGSSASCHMWLSCQQNQQRVEMLHSAFLCRSNSCVCRSHQCSAWWCHRQKTSVWKQSEYWCCREGQLQLEGLSWKKKKKHPPRHCDVIRQVIGACSSLQECVLSQERIRQGGARSCVMRAGAWPTRWVYTRLECRRAGWLLTVRLRTLVP